MNCFDCSREPLPAGVSYAERAAVGACRGCGRGLCDRHGSYDPSARAFLCAACAQPAARP